MFPPEFGFCEYLAIGPCSVHNRLLAEEGPVLGVATKIRPEFLGGEPNRFDPGHS